MDKKLREIINNFSDRICENDCIYLYNYISNIANDINNGESIFLIGQSGVGKTTLLNEIKNYVGVDRYNEGLPENMQPLIINLIIFDGAHSNYNYYSIDDIQLINNLILQGKSCIITSVTDVYFYNINILNKVRKIW